MPLPSLCVSKLGFNISLKKLHRSSGYKNTLNAKICCCSPHQYILSLSESRLNTNPLTWFVCYPVWTLLFVKYSLNISGGTEGHWGHVPPQSFMRGLSAPTKSFGGRHHQYSDVRDHLINKEAARPSQVQQSSQRIQSQVLLAHNKLNSPMLPWAWWSSWVCATVATFSYTKQPCNNLQWSTT